MAEDKIKKVVEFDIKASSDAVAVLRAMQKSMKEIEDQTKRSEDRMKDFGSGLKAAFAGITVDRVVGAFIDTANAMGAVIDKSAMLGLSVTALQEWNFAATTSSATAEDLESGVRGLSRSMSDMNSATSKSAKALHDMGVSAADTTDDALTKIAEAFKNMPDGIKKTEIAMQVFGKSGTTLIPMLDQGAAGLEAMKDQAHELGVVLTETGARSAKEFTDQLDIISKQFFVIRGQIVEGMVPAMTELAKVVSDSLKGEDGWLALGRTIGEAAIEMGAFSTRLITFFRLVSRARDANKEINEALSNWDFSGAIDAGKRAQTDLDNLLDKSEGTVARLRANFVEAQQKADQARAAAKAVPFEGGFIGTGALNPAPPEPYDKLVEFLKKQKIASDEVTHAIKDQTHVERLRFLMLEEGYKITTPQQQKAYDLALAAAKVADQHKVTNEMKEWHAAQAQQGEDIKKFEGNLKSLTETTLDAADPLRVIQREIDDVNLVLAYTTDPQKIQDLHQLHDVLTNKLALSFRSVADEAKGAQDSMTQLIELSGGAMKDFATETSGALVDAFGGAKIEIDKIVRNILANIAKVMLQKVLLEGMNTLLYSNLTRNGILQGMPTAHGDVFPGGVHEFASGGVVASPTLFAHGGGFGLMGEAGPEAILPLKRGASGDLGVRASPVSVTVVNNAGADVKAEETRGVNGERQLRIMVDKAVEEGLGGGRYDRVLSTSYGVSRRGR